MLSVLEKSRERDSGSVFKPARDIRAEAPARTWNRMIPIGRTILTVVGESTGLPLVSVTDPSSFAPPPHGSRLRRFVVFPHQNRLSLSPSRRERNLCGGGGDGAAAGARRVSVQVSYRLAALS
jgi:hypothetical protein